MQAGEAGELGSRNSCNSITFFLKPKLLLTEHTCVSFLLLVANKDGQPHAPSSVGL